MAGSIIQQLTGRAVPDCNLTATDGSQVDLSSLSGRTIVYAYPRTSAPDEAPIDGWDMIPGAKGCTPQSCAFRDHHGELTNSGASTVFGLSTQTTDYQAEMAARLHLPFPILSDVDLMLQRALDLPTFEAGGMTLLQRLTLVISAGRIEHVFFPVATPAQNAEDVLAWLVDNPPA